MPRHGGGKVEGLRTISQPHRVRSPQVVMGRRPVSQGSSEWGSDLAFDR